MITDHADSENMIDGGVQAVTSYLVRALVNTDALDLHVFTFRFGITELRSFVINGYTVHVLPGASLGTLTGFWKDQRTLNACLDRIQPDVIHSQGAGHHGILAMRCPYPAVITIHEIMAEEAKYFSGTSQRIRHWLLSRLSEHHCIRRARHTILISPYVAEYFQERLSGSRYLIPNPIDDHFFSLPREEITSRILFAGRLTPRKGVLDLIRATARSSRSIAVELVLAGSLDDSGYVRELKAEATTLGIQEKVKFVGLLNESQLRAALGRAAVLILPSYQETAPMVITEAMAAGVPVIATDVGGIRYQVDDGTTGFVIPPGDVNALSNRITTLLSDDGLRHAFGRASKGRATEEYRADRVARKTIDVYRQMLS